MTWWTSQRSSVIFRTFTQVVRGFFVVPCSTHPWSNWPWPLPAQSFSTCVWGEDSTHYPVQGEWKLRSMQTKKRRESIIRYDQGMTNRCQQSRGDLIIPRRNGQWGPLKPRDWWPFFCRKESTICYKILHFPTNLGASKKPKNLFLRPHSECFLHFETDHFFDFWRFLILCFESGAPGVWRWHVTTCGCCTPSMVAEVDMDFILGIEAFNLDKILEMDDAFLEALFLEFQKIVIFGYIYIYLKDRFGYLILNDLVLLWTE